MKDSYAVKSRKRGPMKFNDSYSSHRVRPKGYDSKKQKYRDKRWYDHLVFWNKRKTKMKEPKQKRRKKPQMGLFGPGK
jgi:hypothetical protein